jgi:hypothetical protein
VASNELSPFLEAFYGSNFPGHVGLFNRKTKATQYFASANREALIAALIRDGQRFDVYTAISTQIEARKAASRGTADNAAAVFGFFADVDLAAKNEGKNYPKDVDEALAILAKFPLKPTVIIHSGGGLHVHWFLDEPYLLGSKQPIAKAKAIWTAFQRALRDHFRQHDREIDSVGDLVRNFRPPGTLNHRSAAPSPVKVLSTDYSRRYSISEILNFLDSTNFKTQTEAPWRGRVAYHERIREGCAFYKLHTGDGAAHSSEPEWYAALSLTARCENGFDIALIYSAQHPRFHANETERKFAHARDDAGPRTCESIERDLGFEGCSVCPHRGRIKSPVQLGYSSDYDPGREGPIPLGYTKEGGYALLDQVRSIIIIASSNQLLAPQSLLGLAPSAFWARQFPSSKGTFDAFRAGEKIIAACRRAGPFNPHKVRGRGIWFEDGKAIVNLGEPVPPNLKYRYLCFDRIDLGQAADVDANRLLQFLQKFKWRNEADAVLMFGWLAIAPICGVLGWRPHVFLYGPPRCGKTTIHSVANIVLTPLVIATDGQSTEAGIRQMLGPDSIAVIIDEFESDHHIGQIRAVIRLARSASSAETHVLRGTPEGKAMQFSLRTAFLFCAVNPSGLSPADESRIVLLEMMMHDNDKEVARSVAEDEVYFAGLGHGWCRHMVGLAELIPFATQQLVSALPSLDRRHRQNMAALLAGAFVALNRRAPSNEEAHEWAQRYRPTIELHAETLDRDDAAECWQQLITYPVDGYSLGHWLALAHEGIDEDDPSNQLQNARKVLQMFGMTLGDEEGVSCVFIANGAPLVEKAFANTKWAGAGWTRALRKHAGVSVPAHPVYFPHLRSKSRCTAVPTNYLPEPIATAANEKAF